MHPRTAGGFLHIIAFPERKLCADLLTSAHPRILHVLLEITPSIQRIWSGAGGAVLLIYCLCLSHNFADSLVPSSSRVEVRRDYAASVISADPAANKQLIVNGVGMTSLTPITKFMIHLPMSFHEGADPSVLVICFGMGTSYRSALSWDADTTVVELVPSVPKAFGYYHADAAEVLKNPKGHIVIDDGRRFLKRTPLKFDVIATDPPPPLQAAGSSLLYSQEFCDLIKQHLKPKGIAQIWLPAGDLMRDLAPSCDPFTVRFRTCVLFRRSPLRRAYALFHGTDGTAHCRRNSSRECPPARKRI